VHSFDLRIYIRPLPSQFLSLTFCPLLVYTVVTHQIQSLPFRLALTVANMRFSHSIFVATISSSVLAAPQAPTVTVTVYPQTAATPSWTAVSVASPAGVFAPKQAPPPNPYPTTIQIVPYQAPSIPTLSLSPRPQPELIPPVPAPRPSTSTPTLPKSSSRPRPAPRPQAPPPGPASLCGTGRPACAAGQYCYDANLDRVVGTTVANSVGTCYGAACSASVSCPVGQVNAIHKRFL
jgi:hypothetical protein